MPQSFQAIYERGVLRPLEPIGLRDDEVVSLAIVQPQVASIETPPDRQQARRQRDVLMAFVARMESYEDNGPQDGYTNRDHDRLIYGS